jgi:hypothetical protein
MSRHDKGRIELRERLQGEPALVQAGVRDGEAGLVELLLAVDEQVEVDRPRAEAGAAAGAAEPALDLEQAQEQSARGELRVERDGCVDEAGLVEIADRIRLAKR